MSAPLASDLLLPELERQLKEEPHLIPAVKGLFIVTVTKKKKAAAVWYVTFVMSFPIAMSLISWLGIFFCKVYDRVSFIGWWRLDHLSEWYYVGKDTMPVITNDQEKAKDAAKTKVRTVKIQVEDSDLVNFITGG